MYFCKNLTFQTFREVIDDWRDNMAPHYDFCQKQAPVAPHILYKAFKYCDFTNDPCLKCHLKCYGFRLQILRENGEINLSNLRKNLGGFTEKQATSCANKVRHLVDLCKKMFALFVCLVDTVFKSYNS